MRTGSAGACDAATGKLQLRIDAAGTQLLVDGRSLQVPPGGDLDQVLREADARTPEAAKQTTRGGFLFFASS